MPGFVPGLSGGGGDTEGLYGPDNKPSLSRVEGAYSVDAIPTPYGATAYASSYQGRFYDFTPTDDYEFRGIRTHDNDINYGSVKNLRVWRVADQTLIASKTGISHSPNVGKEFLLDAAVTLAAGVEYRIGIESPDGAAGQHGGFTTRPVYSTGISETSVRAQSIPGGSPGTFPKKNYPWYDTYSTFDILYNVGTVEKGVQNPLDPDDARIKSGPTASRPVTSGLASGATLTFFDTTLGKPIWWDGSQWVDATGTAV